MEWGLEYLRRAKLHSKCASCLQVNNNASTLEHIQERRPFGRIRPANFDEAWIISEALKDGIAELPYCTTCHTPYLIIHGCKYQQVCQMCVLNQMLKSKYIIG